MNLNPYRFKIQELELLVSGKTPKKHMAYNYLPYDFFGGHKRISYIRDTYR